MPKPLKSQWEFGELFPAETIRKVLTVTELTASVRRALEREVGTVWVSGEVSNLKLQSSGHVYFSLKDANAQLSCVLFRNEARLVQREFLADGQKLVLQGELTVYEPRGQYQLRVISVQLQGVGALQAAFERLKQKLNAEGLFDQGHKRPIPRFPHSIGLISSPTGAAIRDVLHTIERRHPGLRIVFVPSRVQGQGAAQELVAAIDNLNEYGRVDLILLTRGGGSLEDLWAFNEEPLARAIYNSRLPVVCAVGHEIDFTIADFVADLRAATPTAAAELITEGAHASRRHIADAQANLLAILREHLDWKEEAVSTLARRLARVHPSRHLDTQAQFLDDLAGSLNRCLRSHLRRKQEAFATAGGRWRRAGLGRLLEGRRERFAALALSLRRQPADQVAVRRRQVQELAARLRLLSPGNTLRRGYSITQDAKTGAVIKDAAKVPAGAEIISRLASGQLRSKVSRG